LGIAYLIIPPLILLDIIPAAALLVWLSLPVAIKSARIVITQEGRPLNAALAGTGQTVLAYSVLYWVGLLIS
jgi:1,4-dihydroxy-2-naphthoate octaprenyltransferase